MPGAAGTIIRVSTSKQLEGTSPEKQLEGIRALANEQDFSIAEEHTWIVAESGSLRDRTGFHQARQAAAGGQLSRVYVYSVDRLGRNLLEMLLFLRDLQDLGLECWEVEKRRPLLWDDFILQIEGAVAGKERQEILKRTQDGLVRAIRSGKYSGGIIAYGYRLNPVTKQLEIDEEEAAVVRLIFEWCAEERISTVKIADRLNAMGVPTRYAKDGRKVRRPGKRSAEHTAGIWRAGRVRNMLRNPAYIGAWEYGRRSKKRRPSERIKGLCPAIVSEATFRAASEALRSNMLFATRNSKRPYLLRGLIKCAHCGRTYIGKPGGRRPDRPSVETSRYVCNGRAAWRKLGTPKCHAKPVKADEIEAVVWEDIKAFVKDPEVAIEQLRAKLGPQDETLAAQLAETEEHIRDYRRREKNAIRLATQSKEADPQVLDDVLAEIRRSLASLDAYKASLQARRARGEGLEHELFGVATRLAVLQQRIDRATFEEKRRAVEALVGGIVVNTELVGGQPRAVVTITYRFDEPEPLPILEGEEVAIADRTPARAATSATRFASAAAPLRSSGATRSVSPAPCSIESISTSRCPGLISRSWPAIGQGNPRR